jgi:hypothetical protein
LHALKLASRRARWFAARTDCPASQRLVQPIAVPCSTRHGSRRHARTQRALGRHRYVQMYNKSIEERKNVCVRCGARNGASSSAAAPGGRLTAAATPSRARARR